MSDPAVPRMPTPNQLALASGILVVLAALFISSYAQRGHWFVAFEFIALAVLVTWQSRLGRVLRLRILLWKCRLNAPAIFALHLKWDAQNIASQDLATRADIEVFQRQTGVVLPIDLRDYFTLVNGTK